MENKSLEYYRSKDFLDTIRQKAIHTNKVRSFYNKLKKRNKCVDYTNKLREQLEISGEYARIYKIWKSVSPDLGTEIYNKIITSVLTEDEIDILMLFEFKSPDEL